MEHRNFIKNSILALIPSALAIGALLGCYKASVLETDAYTASSLPTRIDLNAVGDSDVRTYYSSVSGKKGNNLLIELKKVLSNGQKYYSYDSGDAVWRMYEITDRDWEKSPANQIGTYDSTTKIISNYTYKTTDPYVRALYVNRDAENPKTAWASHGERNKANTIEREHIWPKSHGFDSGTAAGARGDPMHLWAADGTANGMHSNLFYGNVDKSKTYKDAGNTHNILWGNLTGTSKSIGSGTVFEPQDSDKGDIARACFYMVARYNNLAGNDNDISGANPNLTLSRSLAENNTTGTSTSTQAYSLGLVQDLLEWNKLDPVDDYEIKRNDLLYRNFTNNRNPFIDYPQWADIIWGGESGSASPSSDTLHGGQVTPSKKVTSLEITTAPTKTQYTVGEKFSSSGMQVKAYYSDGTSEFVTGYTIDKSGDLTAADKIITISFGGKSVTQRIYVTVPQGGGSTTYTWDLITESQSDWSGTYILGSGTSGSIKIAEFSSFSKTADSVSVVNADVVNGVLSGDNVVDSNSVVITKSSNDGAYNIKAGSYYIGRNSTNNGVDANETTAYDNTISYAEGKSSIVGKGGKTLTYFASNSNFKYYAVSNNCLQLFKKVEHAGGVVHPTSITLDNSLSLNVGEKATLNATVNPNNVSDNSVNWSSGNTSVATVDEFGEVTAVGAGTAVITASANDTTGNITATCTVTVTEQEVLDSITVSGSYKTNYFVGDPFVSDDLVVTAHYKRGGVESRTQNVTEQAEFDGFSSETAGTKTVNVIFENVSTTFNVTVSEIPAEENTVTFITSQFEFDNSQSVDSLSKDGFTITTGGSVKYYDSGTALRAYGGSSLTITGIKKIIRVSFVFASSDGQNTISVDKGTCNSSTGYWENSNGVDVLTFSINGSSGHRKIQQIIIKYDDTVEVTATLESISLSGSYSTTFYTGKQFSYDGLVVTAHYSNLSTKTVTPTSITGYDLTNVGQQTVTVTFEEDGVSKTATYQINVVKTALSSLKLSGNYQTEFYINDTFNHNNQVVTAVFNNGDEIDVTNDATWTTPNMLSEANREVKVSYTFDGQTKTKTYQISVVRHIETITTTYSMEILPEMFGTGGYDSGNGSHTVTAVDVDNSENTKEITFTSFDVYQNSGMQWRKSTSYIYNNTDLGEIKSITVDSSAGNFAVNYGTAENNCTSAQVGGGYFKINETGSATGKTSKITIVFKTTIEVDLSRVLTGISLNTVNVQKSFNEGEIFNYDNLVVTANYQGADSEVVSPASVTGFDSSYFGEQTITVTYEERGVSVSATYSITRKELPKTSFIECEGKIITGDYMIGFGERFASSVEGSNNRLVAEAISIDGGTVKTYLANVIWHITELSSGKYTIQSSDGKYLAGNGTSSQVVLNSSDSDSAKWTITLGSGNQYLIKNDSNSAAGKSASFKNNTTPAAYFACYAGDTAAVKLYRQENTAFVKASSLYWIQDGDVITFGRNGKAISTESNNFNGVFSPTAEMNEVSTLYSVSDRSLLTFEVEINDSYYSFKSANGYLTVSGSDTLFTFENTITDNAKFQIVDGLFNCVGTPNRNINGNTITQGERIGAYTKNSNYHVDVYILKEFGEGYKWSEKFLDDTYKCVTTSWSTYGDMYNGLSTQGKLTICTANNNEFGRIEEQAIARYDYMISDGWATGEFLKADGHEVTRSGRQSFSLFGINSEDINSETMLLILIVAAGVVAASSFAIISKKRRKEF